LKDIKADPKYQNIFNVIESALPNKWLQSVKTHISKLNHNSNISKSVGPIFEFLCCYASNIELPVKKSLNKLGYKPLIDKDTAAEITTNWLRFIE
jgi:hypothetical protein